MGTITFEGSNAEQRLAMFVAQLIREGVRFSVLECGAVHGYCYSVKLTGGFEHAAH